MTLIEILIALFIFLIGIIGVLSVFPVAMNSAGRTIGETRSNILAQTVLAQISADWKCPYYSGTVTAVGTGPAGPGDSVTVSGNVPGAVTPGFFLTITSGADQGQSRLITSVSGNQLSVCPNLNPLPQAGTTPPGDSCVITKIGLPWYPIGTVESAVVPAPIPGTGISATSITCNLACRLHQWDGYYVVFTKVASGNWVGISRQIVYTAAAAGTPNARSVLYLDPTQLPNDTNPAQPPVLVNAVVAGDQFAIVDGGYNVNGSGNGFMKSRSGYVMQVDSSVNASSAPAPNTPNDSIDVGRLDPGDPAGQHVIPLSWCPSGPPSNWTPLGPDNTPFFPLWFKNSIWPAPSPWPPSGVSATATGGSASTLTQSGAGWATTNSGVFNDFRGCMAVIVGDLNTTNGTPKYGFLIANQARLITSNTTDTLTVFPNWTLPNNLANPSDPTFWSKITFVIREQPGNYFLAITSGQAAGRVFPITGYTISPPATMGAMPGSDRITCAGVDFRALRVRQALNPGGSAANLTDYVARNADTFSIIGVNGYPNSAYVAYSSAIDVNHSAPPSFSFPLYQLNAFGYPGVADFQTRSDVQTAMPNVPEAQTSDYSYTCIFGGVGALVTGPQHLDIFTFRNYNSALPVVNNQKPVGFLDGYINRP